MSPEADRLLDATLAAFARLEPAPAADRLAEELRALLAQPYPAQQRTPGELVRDALAEAGVPDADLGDEFREAHLAWGAAKARAMTAPAVLYVGNQLMDRTKIAAVVADAGLELVAGPHPTPGALRAFVDLAHPGADEAIRTLAGGGVTTIAFGPHVDDVALVRARSLGAAEALPRSVFFRRLPHLLPVRT